MREPPASVLIVDDVAANRRLLEAFLTPEHYRLRCASGGVEALRSVKEDPPDLILLDVMMPGVDGHEVATKLKADPGTRSIPIIVVTVQTGREACLAALDAGAEEFLVKPVDRAELLLRVRNLLRLKELSDFLASQQMLLEDEVREQGADFEHRLHHQAHHDPLTGLPNRTLFHDTLEQRLLEDSPSGSSAAVLFVDLDHFKDVNDTLGHAIGDELLVEISRRLRRCVRVPDIVGRLGGDEFALIIKTHGGPEAAAKRAMTVQHALRKPFLLSGREVPMTASIGISAHPDDALDADNLINYADTAMFQAKQAGRDRFRFFTAKMNTDVQSRRELEMALRLAIERGEFLLHYQPKVHLDTGSIAGIEALLRWDRPDHGLVHPKDFVPVLESSGLIVEVGSWVIDAVCRQIDQWDRTDIRPLQVSINVAGRQFVEGDVKGDVSRALAQHHVRAHLLELELTESSLMVNTEETIGTLTDLRRLGVQISIDDFGTGYSSLSYLRRFPIDKLKIDMSFIRDITTNKDDAAIALAIVQMAHSLNLEVIAEGVETAAQVAYLSRHGCDQMQGYHFSPPLPVRALEDLLRGIRSPSERAAAAAPTLTIVGSGTSFPTPLEPLRVPPSRSRPLDAGARSAPVPPPSGP